jgi:hypothetical protein
VLLQAPVSPRALLCSVPGTHKKAGVLPSTSGFRPSPVRVCVCARLTAVPTTIMAWLLQTRVCARAWCRALARLCCSTSDATGGCFDLTRSFVIVALALFTLRRAGLVVCVQ